MVAHTYHPNYSGNVNTWLIVQAGLRDPIYKIGEAKRAGSITNGVECLPSKDEVLN
jgi:hypothetical protein